MTPASDGEIFYCDMEPDSLLMESFKRRGDNQIMSLEILSISLGTPLHQLSCLRHVAVPVLSGISVFASKIKQKKLVIWSDNTAAEAATRKGCCASRLQAPV
jgi:hypothetical protein